MLFFNFVQKMIVRLIENQHFFRLIALNKRVLMTVQVHSIYFISRDLIVQLLTTTAIPWYYLSLTAKLRGIHVLSQYESRSTFEFKLTVMTIKKLDRPFA